MSRFVDPTGAVIKIIEQGPPGPKGDGGYSSKRIIVDTFLMPETEYDTGKDLSIANDVVLSVPEDSVLTVKKFSSKTAL